MYAHTRARTHNRTGSVASYDCRPLLHHLLACAKIHMHMHMHMHIYIHMHTYIHIHLQIHMCIHTLSHAHSLSHNQSRSALGTEAAQSQERHKSLTRTRHLSHPLIYRLCSRSADRPRQNLTQWFEVQGAGFAGKPGTLNPKPRTIA